MPTIPNLIVYTYSVLIELKPLSYIHIINSLLASYRHIYKLYIIVTSHFYVCVKICELLNACM